MSFSKLPRITPTHIGFAFLVCIYMLLYYFRFIDDNRLTSWKWVFALIDPAPVAVAGFTALLLAYALSRLDFQGKVPVSSGYILFLVAFCVSAFFWSVPDVIVDSSRYFTYAKRLEVYGVGSFMRQWGSGFEVWTDLPLMPFLYGLVFKVFGEHRIAVQMLVTAMFSLSVVLVYLIGRDLWDEETGLSAGALMLGMPYVYTQTPTLLVDVPSMFFLTLSIYLVLRALKGNGLLSAVCAALSISLVILTKYSLWLLLSVLVVVMAVRLLEKQRPGPWIIRRSVMIGMLSLIIPLVIMYFKYDLLMEQIKLLVEFQRPGLGLWGESFVSTFFFQMHPLIPVAAVLSLGVAIKKRDLRYLIVAWLVILLLVMQVRRIRYLMPVFPMLMLMAAYGISWIPDRQLKRFIVLAVVFTSLVLASMAYHPFMKMNAFSNLHAAGRFLDTMNVDEVEVYTLKQPSTVNPAVAVPLLDLYTKTPLRYNYSMKSHLDEDEIKRASLRFTWAYENPPYYTAYRSVGRRAVAVIAPGRDMDFEDRLTGYSLIKKFDSETGIFRYTPKIYIYR